MTKNMLTTIKCEKCNQNGVFVWCIETCCWRCPNCKEELHYKKEEKDENTGFTSFSHDAKFGVCGCVDVMRTKL